MPKKQIKLIESIEMKLFVKKIKIFVRNEFLCEVGLNLVYNVDVTCKLQLAKDSV